MRKAFLTGLVILLPVFLTIIIFSFLIDLFTAPFVNVVEKTLYTYQEEHIHIFSKDAMMVIARLVILIGLFFFTVLLGFLARVFLFRSFIVLSDKIFRKIPFVKTIFIVTKDLAEALFKTKEGSEKAFQYPVMVPFPSNKSECVGFVTGIIPKVCSDQVPDLVPVFVPTAPHPISGYLMMVEGKDVKRLDMTNEDAVKFTVSCGMITPEVPVKNA